MKWVLYLFVFLILGILIYWCFRNVIEVVKLIKKRKADKKNNDVDSKE